MGLIDRLKVMIGTFVVNSDHVNFLNLFINVKQMLTVLRSFSRVEVDFLSNSQQKIATTVACETM